MKKINKQKIGWTIPTPGPIFTQFDVIYICT